MSNTAKAIAVILFIIVLYYVMTRRKATPAPTQAAPDTSATATDVTADTSDTYQDTSYEHGASYTVPGNPLSNPSAMTSQPATTNTGVANPLLPPSMRNTDIKSITILNANPQTAASTTTATGTATIVTSPNIGFQTTRRTY